MPGDGISAWDWTEETHLGGALGVLEEPRVELCNVWWWNHVRRP